MHPDIDWGYFFSVKGDREETSYFTVRALEVKSLYAGKKEEYVSRKNAIAMKLQHLKAYREREREREKGTKS